MIMLSLIIIYLSDTYYRKQKSLVENH